MTALNNRLAIEGISFIRLTNPHNILKCTLMILRALLWHLQCDKFDHKQGPRTVRKETL